MRTSLFTVTLALLFVAALSFRKTELTKSGLRLLEDRNSIHKLKDSDNDGDDKKFHDANVTKPVTGRPSNQQVLDGGQPFNHQLNDSNFDNKTFHDANVTRHVTGRPSNEHVLDGRPYKHQLNDSSFGDDHKKGANATNRDIEFLPKGQDWRIILEITTYCTNVFVNESEVTVISEPLVDTTTVARAECQDILNTVAQEVILLQAFNESKAGEGKRGVRGRKRKLGPLFFVDGRTNFNKENDTAYDEDHKKDGNSTKPDMELLPKESLIFEISNSCTNVFVNASGVNVIAEPLVDTTTVSRPECQEILDTVAQEVVQSKLFNVSKKGAE